MDTRPQPPFMPIAAPADSLPQSLAGVLDSIWSAIEGGVRDRWTPWGLPLLVTSDGAGAPHARVLALRGADRDARTLLFHTDARSDKVAHLAMDSRAAVTFWHPSDAVEVRFSGAAKIHRDDAIAHEAWKQASPLSQSAARIALAPGTPIGRPTPFARLVQEGDSRRAFAHFAAIAFVAETIDWLWVGADDLRRARFARMGSGWNGSWVVP